MTTFFSVDVETSDTDLADGELFTIGVQPVRWSFGRAPELVNDRFYVRLEHTLLGWPTMDESEAKTATHRWWLEQSDAARGEAYENTALVRHPADVAARMLHEYCVGHEEFPEERIFVANPVAFDKPWIDRLLSGAGIEGTFHYRSLCLRSMKFGLRPGSSWGGDREARAPFIPHHAYWDARAQAEDLIDMLRERDAPADRAQA